MSDLPDRPQRYVRKQILITPEQSRLLRATSRAQGVTEAQVIRAAIDRQLGIEADVDSWKRDLMALAGSLADEPGFSEAVRGNRTGWSAKSLSISKVIGGDG
jgi:hypothetical protein